MRLPASVIALSVTVALAAAGCGGETSAEEEWAGTVCTDISGWKDQIQETTDDMRAELQSPEVGTVAEIEADVRQAADATSQLAADLKALGPPDTESGPQAKQQLDALASQLEGTMNTARQTVESLPEGADAAETAEQLAPLVPSLQSLVTSTEDTLAAIEASGSELKEGFDNADSCEEFR